MSVCAMRVLEGARIGTSFEVAGAERSGITRHCTGASDRGVSETRRVGARGERGK